MSTLGELKQREAAGGEGWPHPKRASAEALIEDRLDEMFAEITASIEAMKGVETLCEALFWLEANGTEITRRWFAIQR